MYLLTVQVQVLTLKAVAFVRTRTAASRGAGDFSAPRTPHAAPATPHRVSCESRDSTLSCSRQIFYIIRRKRLYQRQYAVNLYGCILQLVQCTTSHPRTSRARLWSSAASHLAALSSAALLASPRAAQRARRSAMSASAACGVPSATAARRAACSSAAVANPNPNPYPYPNPNHNPNPNPGPGPRVQARLLERSGGHAPPRHRRRRAIAGLR